MRSRLARTLALLALPALAGCLDATRPTGTPIDCSTLATTLDASAPTLTTTASGLRYRDEVVGTGTTITTGQVVVMHYSACLTDGTQFDQNLDVDTPVAFTVGSGTLIPGFEEGVLRMNVGGTRQLVVPPNLAYGATGVPGIVPPNATVVYTVMPLLAQTPTQ